jgi:NAD/NADP transhydrogenase alpha subunit
MQRFKSMRHAHRRCSCMSSPIQCAAIVGTAQELYAQSQIVLKVRGPSSEELALLPRDAVVVGLLDARAPGVADNLANKASAHSR